MKFYQVYSTVWSYKLKIKIVISFVFMTITGIFGWEDQNIELAPSTHNEYRCFIDLYTCIQFLNQWLWYFNIFKLKTISVENSRDSTYFGFSFFDCGLSSRKLRSFLSPFLNFFTSLSISLLASTFATLLWAFSAFCNFLWARIWRAFSTLSTTAFFFINIAFT